MSTPQPDFSHLDLNANASTATFTDVPVDPPFGPDANATPPADSPFENVTAPPKSAPKSGKPKPVREAFKNLGNNTKPRSGIRALTTDDRDKIANLYVVAGMGLMAFREDTALALANSADACADAWMDVAKKNDRVRRVLLAMVEGGVWGKMFMAHLPILLTLVPDDALKRLPFSVFSSSVDVQAG